MAATARSVRVAARSVGKRGAAVPPVPCRSCILRRAAAFRPFSATELRFVSAMKRRHVTFAPGADILRLGPTDGALYTLYEGWAMRYRALPDGTNQLLDIVLPGDLVGLGGMLLGEHRHGVRTITAASACELDGGRFQRLYRQHPELGLGLLEARMRDLERADTRLTLLGRLSATERTAYLLLELRERLRERGLTQGDECPFPLRRGQLADALGLSKVHLMRALRYLREHGLLHLDGRTLSIPDTRRLARFSGYVAERWLKPYSIL